MKELVDLGNAISELVEEHNTPEGYGDLLTGWGIGALVGQGKSRAYIEELVSTTLDSIFKRLH